MNFPRLTAAAMAAMSLFASQAQAAWPEDKPIEVVVGFSAGGGTDLMARKLLPFVQKRLGHKAQFVVVNKPGAAGEIANAYARNAKADGYTLAVINVPGFLYVPMLTSSPTLAFGHRLRGKAGHSYCAMHERSLA
jgi:tripartite-type tricarboxylate transporter receptor subunit TctC